MIKSLSNLVKDIIKQQSSQVDPVGNLYGSPLVFEKTENVTPNQGTWRLYELNTLQNYSPDEIVNKIFSIESQTAPVISSNNGILDMPVKEGTTLVSTVVDVPQAIGFTIQIFCPNKQIALYIGENLVRRGTNSLITTINVPAGKTPIQIVTYGTSNSNLTIQFPSDISVTVGNFVPPVPRFIDSGSINTNYVDPRTGATGISLSWYNQENVGGWGVYLVQETPYGIAGSILSVGGKYVIVTNYSGTAPYDSSIAVINSITLGSIESSLYDDELKSLVITVNAFQQGDVDFTTIHSGTLKILTFRNLQNILRASQGDTITFVDTNIQSNLSYTYCIDSFAPGDPSLRSAKSQFITKLAGDVTPPGSITLLGVTTDNSKKLSVNYITPNDLDYYSTKAIFYYQGSGTGQVANISYVIDAGIPSTQDSLLIQGITSGTFYFVTSDLLGNTQYVLSGVPFFWNGSGTAIAGINMPPTVALNKLAPIELGGLDSELWTKFKITGSDVETPGSTVVQYKINSGTTDPWITAATNPFTVTVSMSNREGWVMARAFDGTLFSDELVALVPRLVQNSFSTGQVTAATLADSTFTSYVNDGRIVAGTPTAPTSVQNPVALALYRAIVVDMGAYGTLPSDKVFVTDYSVNGGGFTTDAIISTSSKVVHSNLNPANTYSYKYKIRGATDSVYSNATTAISPSNTSEVNIAGVILAGQISSPYLSAINVNIGDIAAGQVRNPGNTAGILFSGTVPGTWTKGALFAGGNPAPGALTTYLDFTATGTNSILHHPGVDLIADGRAIFSGVAKAGSLQIRNDTNITTDYFSITGRGLGQGYRLLFQNGNNLNSIVSSGTYLGIGYASTTGGIGSVPMTANRVEVNGQLWNTLFDIGSTSGAITIDWNNSNVQKVRLIGSGTVTMSNGNFGGVYTLMVFQDGTGSRTVTWATSDASTDIKWPGDIIPTLTTTFNKADIFTFVKSPGISATNHYFGTTSGKNYTG